MLSRSAKRNPFRNEGWNFLPLWDFFLDYPMNEIRIICDRMRCIGFLLDVTQNTPGGDNKMFKRGTFIETKRVLDERDTQLLNGVILVEREEGKEINIVMLM